MGQPTVVRWSSARALSCVVGGPTWLSFHPPCWGKMNRNVRHCVPDMPRCPRPPDMGLPVGENAAPQVLHFGLRCRDHPLAAWMPWCRAATGGGSSR